MKTSKVLKGTMILSISGMIVKIIGAANKIFISRILGGEGMGIYQMAYSIFFIMASVASLGIPIALSIIVAERITYKDYLGVKRVYRIALALVLFLSITTAMGLYFGATWLNKIGIIYDARAVLSLKSVAFAIPFVAVMALYRGYFQGFQNMIPIGLSQVIEQIVRVIGMGSLAVLLIYKGVEYAAAGANFANLPAAIGSFCVLIYFYKKQQKHILKYEEIGKENLQEVSAKNVFFTQPTINIIKRILILALPIFIMPILMPLISVVDTIIVPSRLAVAGLVGKEVTKSFGYLTGMANSLVNMPTILTMAMATSLIPAIVEAKENNNEYEIINRTASMMKLATLLTFPATVGMAVLAIPISLMLYATPNAGPPLMVLSVSMIFLGWQQITTSVLQGLGHTAIPTINLAISMVVKIALTWYLTGLSSFGIKGAAIATDLIFAIAFALNIIYVYRYTEYRINLFEIGKIAVSTAIMGASAYITHNALIFVIGNTFAVIMAILVAILLYFVCLLVTRAITRDELFEFPIIGKKLKKHFKD